MISDLKVGDHVKTYKNGYKSIKYISSFEFLNNNSLDETKNMYQMKGIDQKICDRCAAPSCVFPKVCSNLDTNPRKITPKLPIPLMRSRRWR